MKLKSTICVIIVGLAVSLPFSKVSGQIDSTVDESLFYRVSVEIEDTRMLQQMADIGVAIDHVHIHDDVLYMLVSGYEVKMLEEHGIGYTIHQEDMEQYYEQKLASDPVFQNPSLLQADVPENFVLGSMGGHLTLDEVNAQLDLMHDLYPDLITERFSIGESFEGRDIWSVWIRSEREEGETKPQAYYNSLIHSREPMSMMNLVYYMWWLLENYGDDPLATFLIDKRDMAFSLVLNPDGYEHNRSNFPNGGGLHRKNRRPVGSTNQGIDLNRNFGPFFFWDHPNGGSSITPNSDTYRGAGPFSEPETQALRDFVLENDFRTVFNYHNFSDLLIYPYGALQRETADAHIFTAYAEEMTAENNYEFGTVTETLGYNTRGSADDWFYGYESGNTDGRVNAISFTPEVGDVQDGTGGVWGAFWARAERIVPLSQDNLLPNQLLALYAGPELRFDETLTPEISTTDAEIGDETELVFSFEELYNYGRTLAEVELTAETDSDIAHFTTPEATLIINKDQTFSGSADALILEVDSFAEPGIEIPVTLTLSAPAMKDSYSWEYTLVTTGVPVGTEPITEIPGQVKLSQNYPNPFNPETVIRFALPETAEVSLEVYDSIGRRVQTLVNEQRSAGSHSVRFDAGSLTSGVYLYRLQVGNEVHIKKMTLIK